jgi:hypothetical protein
MTLMKQINADKKELLIRLKSAKSVLSACQQKNGTLMTLMKRINADKKELLIRLKSA